MKKLILSPFSKKSSSGNERLLRASRADTQELLDEFENNALTGYDREQVENMRDKFGENVVTHKQGDSLLKKLFHSFINPFTAILIVLSVIMIITDVILPASRGDWDDFDPYGFSIIWVMVTVSGVVRFLQELRSNKAAEKLKAMIHTTTCVLRDGLRVEIPMDQVVVGDIVCLSVGDMVPADVRIISCKDFFLGESSLTGESNPIEKTAEVQSFDHTNSLELVNLAFMGTNVISGNAMALVIATGDGTHFGDIAETLTIKRAKTSFDKGISSVSWVLIRFMFVMVPIVFVINGFTKGAIMGKGDAWVEALMFGLAVAVGLTPEMLPMIVAAGMAKGAIQMSKKKTIVKNLDSIQNFGAMDILCTDKTGTLTEDEIVLEYYLDINGKEDPRILRHAFLNSHYQTGVRNVMDKAILNHSQDKGMPELAINYVKADEIPFDFTRRRLSVVVKDKQGKTQMITKGAVEEMLSICTYAEYANKQPTLLTDKIKEEILARVEKLNQDGFRVLAVAQKNTPPVEELLSVKDEADMVLIGYLAFLDPPKESAKIAIKALKEHGVSVKVLTGDNAAVALSIAKKVGIEADRVLIGNQVTQLDDEELAELVEKVSIFAKLTPQQKTRIVRILKSNGHVVGFMGDGINDAPALNESDVGISVDNAVDISKESADIILLEKDLMVLEQGIIEGRKTFANTIKYIKMTASSNFGNMFSLVIGSFLLPFLPMIPLQILFLNLIYDISCISIPWDSVDPEYLKKPRKWEAKSIGSFMAWIGPTSSLFDITTYCLMLFYLCPKIMGLPIGVQYSVFGNGFGTLSLSQQIQFMALFHAGWFLECIWTQTLVIHMIRTDKMPFVKSRASTPVLLLTTLGVIIGTILPFTPLGESIGMSGFGGHALEFFGWLLLTVVLYMGLVTVFKKIYIKRYGELL